MSEPIDMTVDSFADPARPGSDELNRDEQEEIVRPASGPRRVNREDAPAVDEDDPAPPRESDAVLPEMDATVPDIGAVQDKWKDEIRDAAKRWDRLTEEDILALGRHEASLTDLVRTRYALSAEETERQVTAFIKDHQSSSL